MIIPKNSNAFVKSFIAATTAGVIYRVEGYFETAGATDMYVQIFDSATLPADNAVPLKSYLAQSNFPFSQHIGEGLVFYNGCCIVLSSTEATKTIVTASGDNMDVRCDLEVSSSLATPVSFSTSGDFVSTVSSLSVYAGSPLNRLRRISVTEQSGVASYVQLYTLIPTTGVTVPWKQFPIAANATLDLEFGQNGINVFSDEAFQTQTTNLRVYLCTSSGVYTSGDATTGTIYAEYIVPSSN